MTKLPRLKAERRTGDERFSQGEQELPFTLRDFWCWSTSDLLNNTTRGVLAEFLVASALDIPASGVRDPWAAYDLITARGVKIEVKSAAYLQSWAQKQPSAVTFRVPKTRAWDADTNELAVDSVRQADVYVFALLAHRDKATVNPLDISQWQFFVLPSLVLDRPGLGYPELRRCNAHGAREPMDLSVTLLRRNDRDRGFPSTAVSGCTTPNITLQRTAGSHSLGTAIQRENS